MISDTLEKWTNILILKLLNLTSNDRKFYWTLTNEIPVVSGLKLKA